MKTMLLGKGSAETFFSDTELTDLCVEGLKKGNFNGKKVLAIIPDTTRSGPIKLIFRAICDALQTQAEKLDFIIALGTHPEMSEEKINHHLGLTVEERNGKFRNVGIFQHRWSRSEELRQIGIISAARMTEISAGLLCEDIPVTINKKVFDYQEIILVGPVFPHEVVGFSGGYKYLFPGIAGPQFLHKFHWLGALITNPKINGTKDTPVRRALNEAASFLNVP
ncbi:MAG: lactate racemase domain-containing protein, partial [Candidatus Ratteibacteria bacterium]